MKTLLSQNNLVFNPPMLGGVLFLSGLPSGGSKIYDRSPYGNVGTITGATWKRLPSGLWYLSFDGSDDTINCGNSPSLEIVGQISIEFWFYYPTAFTKNETFFSKPTGAVQDINLYYYHAGGYFIYVINGTWCLRLAKTELTVGAWNHLLFTILDGTTDNHAYVNGVDKATNQNAPTMTSGTSNLYIGSYIDGGEYVTGGLALIRLYNRVLSNFEALNHVNREKHLFGVW